MVNTCATHLASSPAHPALTLDLDTNSYVFSEALSVPATPPSSMLSRAAASDAVSSSSHPPFGKIKSRPSTLAPFFELSMRTSTPSASARANASALAESSMRAFVAGR